MPNYREVSRDLPKFVGILHFWILVTKILRHINIRFACCLFFGNLVRSMKRTKNSFWRQKESNHTPTTPKPLQQKNPTPTPRLVFWRSRAMPGVQRGLHSARLRDTTFNGQVQLWSSVDSCLEVNSVVGFKKNMSYFPPRFEIRKWSSIWLAHIPSYFSNGLAGSTSNYLDVPGS